MRSLWVSVAACAAACAVSGTAMGDELLRQNRSNSLVLTPTELTPGWGGTHSGAFSPSLTMDGFDSNGGLFAIAEASVFAKVTFSNVRVQVLDTAMGVHAPLQAASGSAFGASVNTPFTLLQQIPAWESDPWQPGDLPGFGAQDEIIMSFSQTADLSSIVSNTFAASNATYDIHVGALLDARGFFSPDSSLVTTGFVNPVDEWVITIEAWAEYGYTVPAPGSVALLGLGGVIAARRRR